MFKQFFINKYFQKLSNTKFFRNDDNAIIGKAKDIIKNLQDQIYYVENPHNDIVFSRIVLQPVTVPWRNNRMNRKSR